MNHRFVPLVFRVRFRVFQLFLQRGQVGILQFRRPLIVQRLLGLLDFMLHLINLALELLDLVNTLFFLVPARLHGIELILLLGNFLAQLCKPILRELVILFLKRGFFDFQLHDLASQVVHFRRHGVHLRTDHGAGFVDEVDGLVRKETVRNVAVGQRRRRNQGIVMDAHAVKNFIAFLQTAENGNCVFDGRLIHHHRLESALQRRVLFNVLPVLVQRRGADAVQLASCQHRLEEVARVHASLRFARTDDRVQLIDEQNNLSLGFLYFVQYGLQTFLKFAPVLGPGNQGAHIQGENRFVFQAFRNVTAHNALSKAFRNGGLADAGLSDENRVVLRFPGKNPDNVSDLRISANDRIQLIFPGSLHEVRSVFLQGVVRILRIVRRHMAALDFGKLRRKGVFRYAMVGENPLDGRRLVCEDPNHQVFDRDIFVSHALRGLLRRAENPVRFRRQIDLRAPADFRQLADCRIQLRQNLVVVCSHLLKQRCDQTAVLIQQSIKNVFGSDILIAVFLRHILCGLDGFNGFLCKIVRVHSIHAPFLFRYVRSFSDQDLLA